MQRFRDLAIGKKLMVVMMLTACAAVLLAGAARITYELAAFRQAAAQDLSIQAKIIGDNCAAALEFDNPRTAQETLAALSARPDIVAACVYRTDGRILAGYPAAVTAPTTTFPPLQAEGQQIGHRDLRLFRRITRKGENLGTVYLRSNLQPHYARLKAGIAVAVGMMVISAILAFFLAARLQHVVTEPVLGLLELAEKIRDRQDYSLRARKHGNDEIGKLADRFNRMLQAIQERDAELWRTYRDLEFSEQRFRQLAESITEVFWMTNLEKTEMLYVSPGYEKIWGRTCGNLYVNPQSWLDAVHPQDRPRVIEAALAKQVAGDYDEEYRIIRPDGSIRWIHDRAFPVQDESGKAYRIAGIAEDITERKQTEEALRHLSGRLLKIQDEERRRIARELHDTTGQNLAALSMTLASLEQTNRKLDTQARQTLADALALTKQSSYELRSLSYLLHPPLLDDHGLTSALRWFVEGFTERSKLQVDLEVSPELPRLPREVETTLFRVVQESLANVHRHAATTTAKIHLGVDQSNVQLDVQDAGRGLPVSETGDSEATVLGVGIAGMRERVRQLGGQMQIDSRGQGTNIKVTIPLNGGTT